MHWCRQYHGEVCDPRWLGLARAAGNGVTPGHVYVVWAYLKETASKAVPRGAISAFDAQALVDFTGWTMEQVTSIVRACCDRGLIVDGEITDWVETQPAKLDATNAARQKRYRAKVKREKLDGNNDSNGVTSVTRNGITGITTTEEIEQSSSSDSLCSFSTSTLKQLTPRTVREQAGAIIDVGEFWTWIADQGIPAHIGIRTMHRSRLAEWLASGLTTASLNEAMARARQKRLQQRNTHPVNLGFLACFVDDVLAGKPAQPETNPGGGYERGDQLSRDFASVR